MAESTTAATKPTQAERVRQMLGDRDPLEVLASTIDVLDGLTLGVDQAIMQRRPAEGKWSPNEILGHLVDAELAFGFRMRAILCEETPKLQPFDQNLWVAIQRHNETATANHLMHFRALRTMNLRLWRGMSDADLRRMGIHAERGPETLHWIRQLMAGHDLIHIDQLSRHMEAARAQVKG